MLLNPYLIDNARKLHKFNSERYTFNNLVPQTTIDNLSPALLIAPPKTEEQEEEILDVKVITFTNQEGEDYDDDDEIINDPQEQPQILELEEEQPEILDSKEEQSEEQSEEQKLESEKIIDTDNINFFENINQQDSSFEEEIINKQDQPDLDNDDDDNDDYDYDYDYDDDKNKSLKKYINKTTGNSIIFDNLTDKPKEGGSDNIKNVSISFF